MNIKLPFSEAKKIYLEAIGLQDIAYGNTLEIHDRFIDRFTYLLSELDELENTNQELFKVKLLELYILIKCTENPLKEFKKKLEVLSNYYVQRGIIENPSLFFSDKDRLSAFLIKHMEDYEKLNESRNQDPS